MRRSAAGQTPLDPSTMISAAQIEDDLAGLPGITDCVRTYSVDHGLDQIAGIAARHGLKVMQGLWLSTTRRRTACRSRPRWRWPSAIPTRSARVVVGNEVLLRGEMSATDLGRHHPRGEGAGARAGDLCRCVGVLAAQPRRRRRGRFRHHPHPAVLGGLPDPGAQCRRPCRIRSAGQVAAAFPGKEIIIGEVGWPSAGRMREGALPSPSNQARVIQDVLALAARENFRVNVIEAFDQPWKRALEGTVGGHWGLLDDATRAPKFVWGEPVSDHPRGAGRRPAAIAVRDLIVSAPPSRRGATRRASACGWR